MMKRKSPGVSLVIALMVSMLVIGIATEVMFAVMRSVAQSADLERSTQVFYAAESGVEAAFFHHNARGQGVKFGDVNSLDSVDNSQKITDSTETKVAWAINGRATDSISGILHENQSVQIPLFWDSASSPSNSILITRNSNFTLSFLNPASSINFGTDEDAVLIDWSISCSDSNGIKTLVPTSPDPKDLCMSGTSYICKGNFRSSPLDNPGRVLPMAETTVEETPASFLGANSGSNCRLSFKPLLPFKDSQTGNKIAGIPFQLTPSGLPNFSYDIAAKVTQGNFEKTIKLTVPERTALGIFNYVIFD